MQLVQQIENLLDKLSKDELILLNKAIIWRIPASRLYKPSC